MLLDYLFVERCRGCSRFIESEPAAPKTVCRPCWDECLQHAHTVDFLDVSHANGCAAVTVTAGTKYDGALKKALYKLKYDDDRLVAVDLAQLLIKAWDALCECGATSDVLLVPVPLHNSRLRKRGFNQAELVARELAKQRFVSIDARLLVRRKATQPHHGLGRLQRQLNIADAFAVARSVVDKEVVLVDDIYTSGATIAEAARVLLSHGCPRVWAITVARAQLASQV